MEMLQSRNTASTRVRLSKWAEIVVVRDVRWKCPQEKTKQSE